MILSRGRPFAVLPALFIAGILGLGAPAPIAESPSAQVPGTTALVTDQFDPAANRPAPSLPGDVMLSLTVTLRPTNASALESFLADLGDPRSAEYRHFLTHEEFVGRYAPSVSAVAEVQSYFEQRGGADFSLTADRFGLSFRMHAADAGGALGVRFVVLSGPPPGGTTPRYDARGTPELPPSLSPLVAGIGGLSNGAIYAPSLSIAERGPRGLVPIGVNSFVIDGTNGDQEPWYLGSDYASAYGATSLFPPSTAVANATFPTGEAVATLLMSGYDETNGTDLPPFDPAVIDAYYNDTFPAAWPHPIVKGVPVSIAGDTPPAPGYFGGVNDSTQNSVENSLDLEMAGSMAPGATLVEFYFGGRLLSDSALSPSLGDSADYFAQCLAAALAFDYSPTRLAAVSGSFGLPDLNDSLWNAELAVAQSMGVTVLAASGDQGNAPNLFSGRFQGPWPTWPGTAAFNTTGTVAVGGVSVTLEGVATGTYDGGLLNASYDPTVTGISDQRTWYDVLGGLGNLSGSEGGASTVVAEPWWQFYSAAQPAIVNATVTEGLSSLGRAVPDVAFPANQTVAYIAQDASGIYFEVLEGTSVASPLLAGLVASWSAVAGHHFGYLDPALYRMASYFEAHPGDASNPFLDVTTGGNFVFRAAPGWDPTTGWGGLDAVRFLAADADPAVANYTYVGPTPGLPPPFEISGGSLSFWLLFILGLSVAIAVALVVTLARPRRPRPTDPSGAVGALPPPVAPGTAWAPAAPGPGPLPPPAPSTFLCPYCGAPRVAEPIRCPNCGRL